ncbi:site-specific integrase [Acetivibrio cellulolyticus]|uniref:site-specific integrase n=1 Tax=Acetivibrio cellulolyticus TaxID=35830 RepID=UPI0001E2D53B|nr:site-specific integrase [Acetivibrio cellulolyticus]
MAMDFEELVALCDEELSHREYTTKYYERIKQNWDSLRKWMRSNHLNDFDEATGNRYCDEEFGTHLMPVRSPASFREKLRSVRMLISYQKNRNFEFRCPSIEYIFDGLVGKVSQEYLEFCRNELLLAEKTLENKRLYLYDFCKFLNSKNITLNDLCIEETEAFFISMNYTLASRHNAARNLSLFLRYAYDNKYSQKDTSIYILPDNYRKDCKLPTTYEEDEIKEVLISVERASSIGKRDYLILLLATEYGLRAKDITNLCFDDIDWDRNVIRINQHKTDFPVEFPLLASIGNAIIDYLKYGRPLSDAPQIIVSAENANKGKPLSSPTIHSVVTKYMKRAGIKNWQNKKHGPHAMRHSLATNLLKKNISMPIISTVMGHQRTETTSTYISVDYGRLKQCVLPMPAMHSPFYNKEGNHGKI